VDGARRGAAVLVEEALLDARAQLPSAGEVADIGGRLAEGLARLDLSVRPHR
jgi:hypothetical protein